MRRLLLLLLLLHYGALSSAALLAAGDHAPALQLHTSSLSEKQRREGRESNGRWEGRNGRRRRAGVGAIRQVRSRTPYTRAIVFSRCPSTLCLRRVLLWLLLLLRCGAARETPVSQSAPLRLLPPLVCHTGKGPLTHTTGCDHDECDPMMRRSVPSASLTVLSRCPFGAFVRPARRLTRPVARCQDPDGHQARPCSSDSSSHG
jgi:hypothetical protein